MAGPWIVLANGRRDRYDRSVPRHWQSAACTPWRLHREDMIRGGEMNNGRLSAASAQACGREVHELTARPGTWQDTTKLVGKLDRTLRERANYLVAGR